ncbi:MAG: DinB family protein [bacterium]
MNFTFDDAIPVLRRTPAVLRALLWDLPDSWVRATEGPDTWSPFDIVGHLIHGERTDWIPRLELLLTYGEERPFTPFDRLAQFEASRGKSLRELIDMFAELRAANLIRLESLGITGKDLERRGRHPELGPVTLGELLATWVAHDLNHLGQIARVMGRQYTEAVGPWVEYLPMLQPGRYHAPRES